MTGTTEQYFQTVCLGIGIGALIFTAIAFLIAQSYYKSMRNARAGIKDDRFTKFLMFLGDHMP